ncbi:hypothetical protein ADUPG1_000409, partial [Aduncisulcus paluster]
MPLVNLQSALYQIRKHVRAGRLDSSKIEIACLNKPFYHILPYDVYDQKSKHGSKSAFIRYNGITIVNPSKSIDEVSISYKPLRTALMTLQSAEERILIDKSSEKRHVQKPSKSKVEKADLSKSKRSKKKKKRLTQQERREAQKALWEEELYEKHQYRSKGRKKKMKLHRQREILNKLHEIESSGEKESEYSDSEISGDGEKTQGSSSTLFPRVCSHIHDHKTYSHAQISKSDLGSYRQARINLPPFPVIMPYHVSQIFRYSKNHSSGSFEKETESSIYYALPGLSQSIFSMGVENNLILSTPLRSRESQINQKRIVKIEHPKSCLGVEEVLQREGILRGHKVSVLQVSGKGRHCVMLCESGKDRFLCVWGNNSCGQLGMCSSGLHGDDFIIHGSDIRSVRYPYQYNNHSIDGEKQSDLPSGLSQDNINSSNIPNIDESNESDDSASIVPPTIIPSSVFSSIPIQIDTSPAHTVVLCADGTVWVAGVCEYAGIRGEYVISKERERKERVVHRIRELEARMDDLKGKEDKMTLAKEEEDCINFEDLHHEMGAISILIERYQAQLLRNVVWNSEGAVCCDKFFPLSEVYVDGRIVYHPIKTDKFPSIQTLIHEEMGLSEEDIIKGDPHGDVVYDEEKGVEIVSKGKRKLLIDDEDDPSISHDDMYGFGSSEGSNDIYAASSSFSHTAAASSSSSASYTLTATISRPLSSFPEFCLVACGYTHTLLLSRLGKVFGCGEGQHGQLGLGYSHHIKVIHDDIYTQVWMDQKKQNEEETLAAQEMEKQEMGGDTFADRSCIDEEMDDDHSIASSDEPGIPLDPFNGGDMGERSIPHVSSSTPSNLIPIPVHISYLSTRQFRPISIACGENFSVFLLNSGRICTCGVNNCGQLGV